MPWNYLFIYFPKGHNRKRLMKILCGNLALTIPFKWLSIRGNLSLQFSWDTIDNQNSLVLFCPFKLLEDMWGEWLGDNFSVSWNLIKHFHLTTKEYKKLQAYNLYGFHKLSMYHYLSSNLVQFYHLKNRVSSRGDFFLI